MADENTYGLDLDDLMEELFLEMEQVQDGGNGHRITMLAETKEEAARLLATRLEPFLTKRFYDSDSQGYKI